MRHISSFAASSLHPSQTLHSGLGNNDLFWNIKQCYKTNVLNVISLEDGVLETDAYERLNWMTENHWK